MDIALAVEKILYASEYRGSVTANTPESWDKVIWNDSRIEKPTWEELEAAWVELSTPTIQDIITEFEDKIQARLDNFARTLTYDGIMSACTYATDPIEMYRIEGQYCVDIRSATWLKAYELMQVIQPQVEAGGEIPSWEDIEIQLPELKWPEGSRGYQPEG